MSFFSSILNFFGTKSQRDMKELTPAAEDIISQESHISQLSNNQLRQKTIDFKSKIDSIIKTFSDKIDVLNTQVSNENNRDIQEKTYKEIDNLTTAKFNAINKQLDKIKSEAFAVIKETASRFHLNKNIVVTANNSDIPPSIE